MPRSHRAGPANDPAGWLAFAALVVCLLAGGPIIARRLAGPLRPVLVIVPVGQPGDELLDTLCGQLGREHTIRRLDALAPPTSAWNSAWGLYNASQFLQSLESVRLQPGEKLLAVADAEAATADMTAVFGLAEQSGQRAVIFTHRLTEGVRPERWRHRVLTTARHEVGHLAGLRHCANSSCAMHFSQSAADTDAKGPGFCEYCERAWLATRDTNRR